MDERLLPLLLASDRCASPDEAEPLDRLRMQKGVFLLAMRGRPEWGHRSRSALTTGVHIHSTWPAQSRAC